MKQVLHYLKIQSFAHLCSLINLDNQGFAVTYLYAVKFYAKIAEIQLPLCRICPFLLAVCGGYDGA